MSEENTSNKNLKICIVCNRILKRYKGRTGYCGNCYQKLRVKEKQDKLPKIPCKCGCGEMIPYLNTKGQPAMFKNYHHVRDPRYFKPLVPKRGAEHPRWIGGRVKDGNGYWMIWKPDYYCADDRGYVHEHVYVYETFHKCCMLKWGVVHHKNENKEDNFILNLQGLTQSRHTAIHNPKKDMSDRVCLKCGSSNTYFIKTSKYFLWYRFEDGFICTKCNEKRRVRDKSKKKIIS